MKLKEVPILTNSKPEFFKTKTKQNEILLSLGAPHVDSFDYMIDEGLADCAKNIHPVEFEIPNGERVKLFVESITISPPQVPVSCIAAKNKKIFPSECRQRACTYSGACSVGVGWSINGVPRPTVDKSMGEIPIMLRTKTCNLNGLKPEELVKRGEHENEWGGYFIIKGHEKLIRMLLMTRKNFPIAVQRNTWRDRGQHFGDVGIMVRSVRTDQTATTNVLHYLTNGTAKFMFTYRKTFSFVPIVLLLKALKNCTDEYIYQRLIAGYEDDQYYEGCIQKMLRSVHDETARHTHEDCKKYLGEVFQSKFYHLPQWKSHMEVTDYMLNECVLIHLDDHEDKFNFIILMTQKLFQCAQNKYKIENSDSVMMQEVLLGGHLYQKVIKDRTESWLEQLKFAILKQAEQTNFILNASTFMQACKIAGSIERSVGNFLSTGNLVSKSGLGLMQASGLVIMAENINRMRYMSHFRAVHRGSFFVEMRTTEARQLLPDAWGFICPVHTPDGSPCGLLNHLTIDCIVSDSPNEQIVENVPRVLTNYGMVPLDSAKINFKSHFPVLLEGKVIGHISKSIAEQVATELRLLKIEGVQLPKLMEIVLVPDKQNGQYPGFFLFVGTARMMRPVLNLRAKKIEYIGTFEQVYLEVAISADEAYEGVTTHLELSKTAFMSNLANLIPMPDCNQSPRNMYQCQMGKQTMGTPCHNWQLQAETKMYRLQTPGTPLFRPVHHDNIELDDFAMGTNAIVAVISYTGYDMEDAMIINKSADERGFAHGQIYKSQFIEMEGTSFFVRNPHDKNLDEFIDNDGLPHSGRRIKTGEVLYCYFDTNESAYKTKKYLGSEECIVDNVKLCGTFNADSKKVVCLTLRVPRNPSVGDKFASRAGQKGILSQKWPAEDLPFTETGLIPDIVFNPHGFPSRMTIAMMIETMAGKSSALHGFVHDATPFRFDEKNTAIDHFGRLLQAGGYNYYGTERVYSGIDGREMTAEIFMGVVHYQRLRHMVSDKWQVRSTGPIDNVTHQPVKGRKRGGGVRFGEMERDALIAHGASFLLQDRLLHCSDRISTIICRTCGTLVGPVSEISKQDNHSINRTAATCRLCKDKAVIENIQIPYIFKYLVAQLSSCNINVKMNFSSI